MTHATQPPPAVADQIWSLPDFEGEDRPYRVCAVTSSLSVCLQGLEGGPWRVLSLGELMERGELIEDVGEPEPDPLEFLRDQEVIRVREMARLLGVRSATYSNWRSRGVLDRPRNRCVGTLVLTLSRGMTWYGVRDWFYRPRHQLGGKRPVDLLEEERYSELLELAIRGLSQ